MGIAIVSYVHSIAIALSQLQVYNIFKDSLRFSISAVINTGKFVTSAFHVGQMESG